MMLCELARSVASRGQPGKRASLESLARASTRKTGFAYAPRHPCSHSLPGVGITCRRTRDWRESFIGVGFCGRRQRADYDRPRGTGTRLEFSVVGILAFPQLLVRHGTICLVDPRHLGGGDADVATAVDVVIRGCHVVRNACNGADAQRHGGRTHTGAGGRGQDLLPARLGARLYGHSPQQTPARDAGKAAAASKLDATA